MTVFSGCKRLAGIAGQREDHGALPSAFWSRHLGGLCRQGTPTCLPKMLRLVGLDEISTDPENVAFSGVETVREAGALNQVLFGVPVPAGVRDGFHIKVVWWHDFLEFEAVQGPIDRFAGGIAHHVGHGRLVSHTATMRKISLNQWPVQPLWNWLQVLLILTKLPCERHE